MDYVQVLRMAKDMLRNEEPRCPACGVEVDRPKCAFELNPVDCPRHALRNKWMAKVTALAKRLATIPKRALDELIEHPEKVSARTAMSRRTLSLPAKLARTLGLIPDLSLGYVLDYGCGRGDDVHFLRKQGFRAIGYDPASPIRDDCSWFCFRKLRRGNLFSTVLCSYVLNTIPSVKEREKALRGAFAHTQSTLVVSVRTDVSTFKKALPCFDGFLTKSGTFQRPYRADEFCAFVAKTLKRPVCQLAPGVVVVEKT